MERFIVYKNDTFAKDYRGPTPLVEREQWVAVTVNNQSDWVQVGNSGKLMELYTVRHGGLPWWHSSSAEG